MERKPFIWSELFIGNWELFQNYLRRPDTIFVYDIDGILANSAKIVLKKFTQDFKIKTNAHEIDCWNYLTGLAKKHGLTEEEIKQAENAWYDPEVLIKAPKHLYIKPAVQKTLDAFGVERNFILSSRNPDLKDSTIRWFAREIPEINKENILMREDASIKSTDFKAAMIRRLAKQASGVVFVDDSPDFAEAVLSDGIQNCLVVNIPQGVIMPNFRHERLIIIKRYPEEIQAMYPFMHALDKALDR